MSTGSTYANFFPAAPSVLQEKKRAARERNRANVPSVDRSGIVAASYQRSPSLTEDGVQEGRDHASRDGHDPMDIDDKSSAAGDSGDLLNGVGSASSMASTRSSTFSNGGQTGISARAGAGVRVQDLTPITNDDLSPPDNAYSPKSTRTQILDPKPNEHAFSFDSDQTIRPTMEAFTPVPTPPRATIAQARPGPGEPKGLKAIYDPELDPKLSMKDKRKAKVKYRNFGEVSTLEPLELGLTNLAQDNESPPPDPRLAVPGYISTNFNLRMTGEANVWKQRLRPAPYVIAAYPWDAAISVGPGPASSVVVTEFDPFTPDSQIRAVLGSYGEIADVANQTDPATGIYLGVCLVRYCDSRLGRGIYVTAADAARRAEKEGSGQRIGLNTIKVRRDAGGRRCKRIVAELTERNRRKEAEEVAKRAAAAPVEIKISQPAPPPNAPKGPAARHPVKLLDGPRVQAAGPSFRSGHRLDLVEVEPVLSKIRRKPYIFISQDNVPVLSTTIPHLERRLKSYDWKEIRCDVSGYYIIFEDSRRGEDEAVKTYAETNRRPLFTYSMVMECQQYGNPDYERSPSPERMMELKRQKDLEERLLQEEDEDLEEEKRERAENLDPVRAVKEMLETEFKDKILADIKSRVIVPALFEALDPDRHADKRRKLGLADPTDSRQQQAYLTIADASRTPDRQLHARPGQPGSLRKALHAAREGGARQPADNVFLDERRQQRPRRKPELRTLHHQLQDYYGDESEDERRPTGRETADHDSRSVSRMSSVAPDDDSVSTPRKKRKLTRGESPMEEESGEEGAEHFNNLDSGLLKKDPEDLGDNDLRRIVDALPGSFKLARRAKAELVARHKAREDDRLFRIKAEEGAGTPMAVDIPTPSDLPTVDIVLDSNELSGKDKKKGRAKKKTKKQVFQEREAAKAEVLRLQMYEELAPVPEVIAEEEEPAVDLAEEEAELRADVEWGVSTEAPRRTVEDDPDMLLDIDGWQHLLKDEEDFAFLKKALVHELQANIVDPNGWVYRQKEIKALNTNGHRGIVRDTPRIQGYYVPNLTGCARTEGFNKILESEKSKYLPHRIKVAKARERREAEAVEAKTNPMVAAEAARQEKLASTASSRSARANNRIVAKDISTFKQNLAADGQHVDAIRFNQLKKRKKLVKFDRSAIHGWGLYAEENIAQTDMIIEYVGEKVRQAVANVRELRYQKQGMGSSYLFRIDDDTVIDATKKGGIARFINHSCSPNCTAKIIQVEGTSRIVIYALKDIRKSKLYALRTIS